MPIHLDSLTHFSRNLPRISSKGVNLKKLTPVSLLDVVLRFDHILKLHTLQFTSFEVLNPCQDYSPVHSGLRLPKKAQAPSRMSRPESPAA